MKCPNCDFEINSAAELGSKGGKATAKNMSAKQRKERAKKAALARWGSLYNHPKK